MNQHFDIIGDIHGHHDKLVALLERLGYKRERGGWGHAERMAISVGHRNPKASQSFQINDLPGPIAVSECASNNAA